MGNGPTSTDRCSTWKEQHRSCRDGDPAAETYREAENLIFRRAQQDSFPEEIHLLKASKPIPSSSRLLTLSPELDEAGDLIRVGGRLHRAEALDRTTMQF
ncbi:hypothetical protein SKAU_G00235750 [Synaphobranchus kaupii]|uniref:Uncharacterized protein n=1 Tax=Synaphobranchus kaupii TaxID=118154 RepID=A0A9Q1F6K7_SYNKA|nr:hypothetical protein SKAU_G00235750 [Synaphobranchus kaupii]